jgi:transcription elongation factor Elf1
VQQHDHLRPFSPRTMSTEKPNTLNVPHEEMCQQFKGRIICGRCGNSDSTKFTYILPMDGRVLVQCSHCGLTFFESIEDSQNNGTQK